MEGTIPWYVLLQLPGTHGSVCIQHSVHISLQVHLQASPQQQVQPCISMHRSGHLPTKAHLDQNRHLAKSWCKYLHIHKHQHIPEKHACKWLDFWRHTHTLYTICVCNATHTHKHLHVSAHTCLSKRALDLEVGFCPEFQSSAE